MKDEFHIKNSMYSRVRQILRNPQTEPLWHDQPPFLTARVALFETEATGLGAFGESQSVPVSGFTEQQNLAETALEDAAHPLARAVRLYYREMDNHLEASGWDLALTDWRRMRENALLEKAKALRTVALSLTTGTPPPGAPFGITADAVNSLGDVIDDYQVIIGGPGAARAGRKAKTAALRPRYRVVDGLLEDIDDLIIALKNKSDAHRLFVESYFNARRIGGHTPPDEEENPPASPTPPTP